VNGLNNQEVAPTNTLNKQPSVNNVYETKNRSLPDDSIITLAFTQAICDHTPLICKNYRF